MVPKHALLGACEQFQATFLAALQNQQCKIRGLGGIVLGLGGWSKDEIKDITIKMSQAL